jgi:hypothetical protein
MRINIASVNFSPAVLSRRANYDGNFLVSEANHHA